MLITFTWINVFWLSFLTSRYLLTAFDTSIYP